MNRFDDVKRLERDKEIQENGSKLISKIRAMKASNELSVFNAVLDIFVNDSKEFCVNKNQRLLLQQFVDLHSHYSNGSCENYLNVHPINLGLLHEAYGRVFSLIDAINLTPSRYYVFDKVRTMYEKY